MKIVITFFALLLAFPPAADAQARGAGPTQRTTVETVYLNAPLSPIKEVPSLAGMDAEGGATLQLHLQRDDDGALTSAFVTFQVFVRPTKPDSVLAIHIHEGAAGENGPVVIPSGLEFGGDPLPAGPEPIRIWRQTSMTDAASLAVVRSVLENPGDLSSKGRPSPRRRSPRRVGRKATLRRPGCAWQRVVVDDQWELSTASPYNKSRAGTGIQPFQRIQPCRRTISTFEARGSTIFGTSASGYRTKS